MNILTKKNKLITLFTLITISLFFGQENINAQGSPLQARQDKLYKAAEEKREEIINIDKTISTKIETEKVIERRIDELNRRDAVEKNHSHSPYDKERDSLKERRATIKKERTDLEEKRKSEQQTYTGYLNRIAEIDIEKTTGVDIKKKRMEQQTLLNELNSNIEYCERRIAWYRSKRNCDQDTINKLKKQRDEVQKEKDALDQQIKNGMKKVENDAIRRKINNIRNEQFKFDYENPLGVNSFTDWLSNLLTQIYAILAWITVIMIVVGGIMYMISSGNQARMELAKKIITFALIGFAIGVAAPTLLKEIMDLAKQSAGQQDPELISNAPWIKTILENIMNFVLAGIGILGIIGFVVSGIMLITAGGNQTNADKARKGILYSIVGVSIAGASLIIIQQIMELLSS